MAHPRVKVVLFALYQFISCQNHRPALDRIGKRMIAELAKERGSRHSQEIVFEVRHELSKAGYSEGVSALAIQGLEEGVR